jgi:very-short-patch-repair endonuclease
MVPRMPGVDHVDLHSARQPVEGSLQERVAALAGRQYGVASRTQLLRMGLTAPAIDARVARGVLHVVHRGIYAVGHPAVAPDGLRLAAVLACGPGAALSHVSAAALLRIRETTSALHDVTARTRGRRPGLRVHRAALDPRDAGTVRGIPVTAPARTLVDLADVLESQAVTRAFEEAIRLRLLTARDLEDALARHPGRRAHAVLRGELGRHLPGLRRTRSELERAFVRLVARHAIVPAPRINAHVAGHEVDAYWPDHGLAVELDSLEFHRTRPAMRRDYDKALALTRAGLHVVRLDWEQVTAQAPRTADTLRALLAAAG